MAETLIFVPDLMCDARAFWHQLVALSARWPVQIHVPREGQSVEAMAADLLAAAPEAFTLIGAGLGGNVALEVLRRVPQRVSRIVLIGVAVQTEPPKAAAEREARLVAAQVGRLLAAVAEEVPADALAAGPVRAEILGLLQDMAHALGPEVYLRQSRAMQRRPDQQKVLRMATLPALVICGAEDPITLPRRHEFIAELMPHGRLELIAGAGHLPALEQPQVVSDLLRRWLRETAPQADICVGG